jgi:hypothetical protein
MSYYFIQSTQEKEEVINVDLYYDNKENFIGKYNGKVLNGLPHGSGNINYNNGDEFFGTFENGVIEGEGVLILKKGEKYNGFFSKGKKNGYGTLKSADGETYEGEWKDDVKCGGGVYTYNNGDVYKGFWENDKYSGEGYFNYSNGDQYVGYWKEGKREGKGKLTKDNGEIVEGEWIADVFQLPNQIDPLFNDAARIVVEQQQGSTSLIQRKLSLGYNRASKIIEQLEAAGIVGLYQPDKARNVLVANLDDLEKILAGNEKGSSYAQKETPQAANDEGISPTIEDKNTKSVTEGSNGKPRIRLTWLFIILAVVLLLFAGWYFFYPFQANENTQQLNKTIMPLESGGYRITLNQNNQISKGTFDITNINNESEGKAIINVYGGPLNSTFFRQELKFTIKNSIVDIEQLGRATILESKSHIVLKSVEDNPYDFEIVQLKFD